MNLDEKNIKEQVWNIDELTFNAKNFAENLSKFQKNSKIIVILRHSYRKKIRSVEEVINLGLSPQGFKIAQNFGEKLPKERPIRLFYSSVLRCQQTAEAIKEGFNGIGGTAELKGALEPLFKIGITAEIFSREVFNRTPRVFIARWVAGLYPIEHISPFVSYCQNAAKVIWNLIIEAPERGIDIHITHDTHLLAFRWGWFGIPLGPKWVHYLGGFAFTLKERQLLLLCEDNIESFELPFWWGNIKKEGI